MSMRGVQKHGSSTITTQFSGVFRDTFRPSRRVLPARAQPGHQEANEVRLRAVVRTAIDFTPPARPNSGHGSRILPPAGPKPVLEEGTLLTPKFDRMASSPPWSPTMRAGKS